MLVVIPTRGSNRVIREVFRIEELAKLVDEIFILHRDADILSYTFPNNVVLKEVDFGVSKARQYGVMYAIEKGHELFLQVDDDVATVGWEKFIVPMKKAMKKFSWLGALEVQSGVRAFYTSTNFTTQTFLPSEFNLQLRWSPSQFWMGRTLAFQEIEGFMPQLVSMEDLDVGLQLCKKGWAQACLFGPVFGLTRSRTNPKRREYQGGFDIGEREAHMPQDLAFLKERHSELIKKAYLVKNKNKTLSQVIKIDWEEYGKRIWERWQGTKFDIKFLAALLATKIPRFRNYIF
jgi:hypothetical protein